ncbi:DUF421 domain-containing protein [Evansella cellulosilytica]|uniref:YetF C-terminal domain-containing protein n=1 Tax=Evansella cellulosilytica (strain ATCC 21833 / DSM 2522 / FERM P-1141 / JCM 9156 / N-4) TaxID=649639 RepID=E6TV77_EVAC2|nr:DUF421 domain-containing protein [Evansella cellulosilytica]ADU29761.1 protein of unknown function DUF421 [Evansella cellulosilytica DSM 2522]
MVFGTMIMRTIVIYIVILLVFRMMGKREIGELSVVDFVISIMLAELAVLSIEDSSTPMSHQIVPMLVLMFIQISLAYVSLKSENLRKFIDGKPSVIIRNGKIDEKEMRKQRYNFDDLMLQLRQKDIKYMSDVEFAILEPSGDLSIIKKETGPNAKSHPHFLPLPLILDGKIKHDHLKQLGKNQFWLRQQLKNLGFKDIKKISFCSLKEDDSFYVDLIDE